MTDSKKFTVVVVEARRRLASSWPNATTCSVIFARWSNMFDWMKKNTRINEINTYRLEHYFELELLWERSKSEKTMNEEDDSMVNLPFSTGLILHSNHRCVDVQIQEFHLVEYSNLFLIGQVTSLFRRQVAQHNLVISIWIRFQFLITKIII